MTKKYIALCIIAIIVSFVAGCSMSDSQTNVSMTVSAAEDNFHFEEIHNENDVSFYRETSTDVMYVLYGDSYHGPGLTVMMDPQTSGPLTYDNWVKNYKK